MAGLGIESNANIAGGFPFGMGGGFGGGFGGIAPVGLIGLNNLFDRDKGHDHHGRKDDCNAGDIAARVVELQNSANIREEIGALGNEMQQAFATQNLANIAQFNQVQSALCSIDKTAAVAALEAKIASLQSTNEIKSDINALSVKTDMQACEILRAINADGDATRALINANTVNSLRDELLQERRRSDSREIEINVTQTNQQLQNQMQAQFQSQNNFLHNAFGLFGDQLNKANNSIVAVGSTLTGTGQNASQANTKVS
jgi:hypothetical protein